MDENKVWLELSSRIEDARGAVNAHQSEIISANRVSYPSLVDNWKKFHRMYHGILPEKNTPWVGASNLHIPITQIVVDTITSIITNSILGNSPIVTVRPYPELGVDVEEAARKLEFFLNYAIREEIRGFRQVFTQWVRQAVLYGTAILKVVWSAETRNIKVRDFLEGGKKLITVKTYDAPRLCVVDLENFIIPSFARDIQDAPFVAERIFVPLQVLKQREKEGFYSGIDELVTMMYQPSEVERQGADELGVRYPQLIEGVDIYDYWGGYDLDGDGYEEEYHIVMAADQPKILRIEEPPYYHGKRPYVRYNFLREPNQFYGIGVGQMIQHLQEEINAIHNQRMDNVNLIINKVFKYRPNEYFEDPDDIIFAPGSKIPVNEMDDIMPLVTGDVPVSSYNEEQIVRDYIERLTGVTDFSLGRIPSTARRTPATLGVAVIAEGNKKLQERLILLQESLEEVLDMVQWLYYQFIPQEKVFKAPGASVLMTITPEDLRHQYRFDITGADVTTSKEIRFQQSLQMYALLSNNPIVASNPKALAYLTKQLLLSSNLPNIEEVLNDKDFQQMLEQQAAQGGGSEGLNDIVRQLVGQATGQQGAGLGGLSTGGARRLGISNVSQGVEGANRVPPQGQGTANQ
ncbi:MAG: hypothetical protein AB7E45_04880 [Candidatus Caldatribacteriota bacterium]